MLHYINSYINNRMCVISLLVEHAGIFSYNRNIIYSTATKELNSK